MKHRLYLSQLTDSQLIDMIEELEILHIKEGQLPDNSKVRELSRMIKEDYGIVGDISMAETSIKWEVFNRFKMRKQ